MNKINSDAWVSHADGLQTLKGDIEHGLRASLSGPAVLMFGNGPAIGVVDFTFATGDTVSDQSSPGFAPRALEGTLTLEVDVDWPMTPALYALRRVDTRGDHDSAADLQPADYVATSFEVLQDVAKMLGWSDGTWTITTTSKKLEHGLSFRFLDGELWGETFAWTRHDADAVAWAKAIDAELRDCPFLLPDRWWKITPPSPRVPTLYDFRYDECRTRHPLAPVEPGTRCLLSTARHDALSGQWRPSSDRVLTHYSAEPGDLFRKAREWGLKNRPGWQWRVFDTVSGVSLPAYTALGNRELGLTIAADLATGQRLPNYLAPQEWNPPVVAPLDRSRGQLVTGILAAVILVALLGLFARQFLLNF